MRKEKSDKERKEKDQKEKEKEKKEEQEKEIKESAKEKKISEVVEKGQEVKKASKVINKTVRKNIKLHSPTFLKLQAINTDQSQKIILDVRGTKFHTCLRTLNTYISILSKMLAPNSPLKPMDGIYFFDRDSTLFRHILNFMRTGEVPCLNIKQLLNLKGEAIYFECERLLIEIEKRLKGEIGLEE